MRIGGYEGELECRECIEDEKRNGKVASFPLERIFDVKRPFNRNIGYQGTYL